MKDMFRGWWMGPVLFAVIGGPVAGAVTMLIVLVQSPDFGQPFDPFLLVFVPLGLIVGTFFALAAGFPAVLLCGAASVVLAPSRIGNMAYVLPMAALSGSLAVVGFWLDVFGWRRGEAFDMQQAWLFAVGWAAGAAVVCGLLRRKGRPGQGAGT